MGAAAPKLSESVFQNRVIEAAKLYGWRVAHFRPALTRSGRWATAMQGDKGSRTWCSRGLGR